MGRSGKVAASDPLAMTTALLARNPDPTQDEIRRELSGNLCRCGTHLEIVNAVLRAAELTRQACPKDPRP